MGDSKDLVILGTGGYAQELLWIVDDLNALNPTWNFLGFVDPSGADGKGLSYYDRPILGGWRNVPRHGALYFACGAEAPHLRKNQCQEAEKLGYKPATLIHPSVICARHVDVGEGTVIGAGCILAPYSKIGRHCAINLQVPIGHNSVIGDYCVISPGAQILASVLLEECVFIGANATVHVGTRVGTGALVGANSFLLNNLPPAKSAIGVPASSFTRSTETSAGVLQEPKKRLRKKREG